ncbi:hypothetical protein [Actinoplanes sp. GCM10030250]|uniref:hypothetical protein n=1 Tax=Actinoplanes sp. GCM10030250 TaxID=3273376 RepID=UPI003610A054
MTRAEALRDFLTQGAERLLGVAADLRNRGLSLRQLPFTGLSRSTIAGMLDGAWHNLQQIKGVSGALGW